MEFLPAVLVLVIAAIIILACLKRDWIRGVRSRGERAGKRKELSDIEREIEKEIIRIRSGRGPGKRGEVRIEELLKRRRRLNK
jgi:hypothetical protein